MPMRLDVLQDAAAATLITSTLSTTSTPSPHSITTISPHHGWQQHFPQSDGGPTSIVINISDGGSTGRGILIGILSAFGSAGVAVLVLAIFFFFRYTHKGRILLDRIGRPGEFDDEQAFAREEAEALETMDEMQRAEYLRAKGTFTPRFGISWLILCSFCPSEPTRNRPDRHLTVSIPGYTRERRVRLGV